LRTLLRGRLDFTGLAGAPDTGFTTDRDLVPDGVEVREAAVLIPIIARAEPQLLLTLRPDHLPRHAGQVSFPGGRIDDGDDGPVAAALREAEEEVGLARGMIEPMGCLAPFFAPSGYRIVPVVALVDPAAALEIDPAEVVEAFEVPFAYAMDPAHHVRRSAELGGRAREFYEIIYDRHRIWGVTAGIIVELHRALYGPAPSGSG
jgi:8-oxo-dGTP pyrophosphatase MutT (NUDIX family)